MSREKALSDGELGGELGAGFDAAGAVGTGDDEVAGVGDGHAGGEEVACGGTQKVSEETRPSSRERTHR